MHEQIAEALKNWELAVRFANDHKQEMQAAHAKGLCHVGCLLINDGHQHLTWLGEQCMTLQQRRIEEPDAQA